MERIAQLASDAQALRTAAALADTGEWPTLGRDAGLLWGECLGSGPQPYAVRIDLTAAAYACSCPSRRQPCKHALGLLIKLAHGAVADAAQPEFVRTWLEQHPHRVETSPPPATPSGAPDPAAREQRVAKREQRIAIGLEQLEIWLADIVSEGLAATRQQSVSFWSHMAARLVDAQAPGLARWVSELGETAVTSDDWQTELLAGLGRLQLLIDAYRNRQALPDDLAAEVRTLVGWTQDQEALRERPGIRDLWHVVGRRQTETDQVRTQHTWLHGEQTQQFALLLQFAVGNQPLPATHLVGQVLDAELVFFAGCPRLRALEKIRHATRGTRGNLRDNMGERMDGNVAQPLTIAAMQAEYALALAANPWHQRQPVLLGPVQPTLLDTRLQLMDLEHRRVPIAREFAHAWHLLALACTDPLHTFGEWNGRTFTPLSVERAGQLYTFTRLGDLPILSRAA